VLLLPAGLPVAWLAIAALTILAFQHFRYALELKDSQLASAAIFLLPGAFLLFLLLLNSERRYSRNLGVEWKGRHIATTDIAQGTDVKLTSKP
jgi:hypothetical protein